MPSTSRTRILVTRTYSTDEYIPKAGEVIVVRLSQPLFGPGSTLGSGRDLPSHATRYNHHHVVVLLATITQRVYEEVFELTVYPMPAYSGVDPISGLSSTEWLLSQSAEYQKLHIPVPYEQMAPVTSSHPSFPTPTQFGDPIEVGGWKDRRPSWIQVVPMLTKLSLSTKVCIRFSWRQVFAHQHDS
jgi:hypothetical protein